MKISLRFEKFRASYTTSSMARLDGRFGRQGRVSIK